MIIGRPVAPHEQIWLDTARRVGEIVGGLPAAQLGTPVPAAGGLTVHALVAHLVATGADALDGRIHGVLDREPEVGDVEAAEAAPVGDLLARWDEQSVSLAALVRDDPTGVRLLVDLTGVEHDLRTALGRPGARDDDAVVASIEAMAGVLSERFAAAGVPGLRITCEQWGHDTSEPCHEILVADRFELFRGLGGRRSAEEIRRWMWSSDPERYLPHFAVYGALRESPLDEPDPTVPPEYAERLRGQSWREPLPT